MIQAQTRYLGLCIHSPYLFNEQSLQSFFTQIIDKRKLTLLLIDTYTARPFKRDSNDLFIDLELVEDIMENVAMKFIKVEAEFFKFLIQNAFGISVVEMSNINQQIDSLFDENSKQEFKIQLPEVSFFKLKNQEYPCIYIDINNKKEEVKKITDINKDEFILLLQNYIDFLEDLNPSQIQYMILRVFEEFENQQSLILSIVKDYIASLKTRDLENEEDNEDEVAQVQETDKDYDEY